MGPITLFDKSFLQSLSLDEAVIFDHLFLTNICPLFFVETLADLTKKTRKGRTPLDEVRIIAEKTPCEHSVPNVFHVDICVSELYGGRVLMDRRPVIGGGQVKSTSSQKGVVYPPTPEADAFARWQKGQFQEAEAIVARQWRAYVDTLDFSRIQQLLNGIGVNNRMVKSLDDAFRLSSYIDSTGGDHEIFNLIFQTFGIPTYHFAQTYARWAQAGFPPLRTYAPYTMHMMKIDAFYFCALASNHISRQRVTNKVDLGYLYYLPFVMMFVSSDRLHQRCTPYFLGKDQGFVWGPDLKADLANLVKRFKALPETVKERGVSYFASHPPADTSFLVTRLWDKFLPKWREPRKRSPPTEKSASSRIIVDIRELKNAPVLTGPDGDLGDAEPDFIVIERKVPRKRGQWWTVPKDTPERKGS